jgi:hypothetical protein
MTRFINVEIEIAIIRVNFFAMCSENYIYLVLDVFMAILFALNQIAIFCNSLDTYRGAVHSVFFLLRGKLCHLRITLEKVLSPNRNNLYSTKIE